MVKWMRGPRPSRRVAPILLTILAPIALIAAVAGCVTMGSRFPGEPVQQIRIGSTTKSELIATFGLPDRRGIEDGDSTWTWVDYRYGIFSQTRTRDLLVRFDSSSRVRSYTYSSNVD